MKKTLPILVLILTLLVSAASAAPTRRREELFGLNEAELMALQPLLYAAAGAAFGNDIPRMSGQAAPEPSLVMAVMGRALQAGLFPVETSDQTLALSDAQVQDMAGKLFDRATALDFTPAQGAGFTRTPEGFVFDLSAPGDHVGVYAYLAAPGEDGLLNVKGDVYRLSGIQGMAEEAPEDSIQWLGHMGMMLRKAEGAPAGYILVSYAVNEHYQARGFSQFFDEENGYELSYPDIFPVHEEPLAKGQPLELSSADGQAKLSVTFVPGNLEALEAAWKAETGHPADTNVWVNEYGQLTMQGPREMRLAMPDEASGQCAVLTLIKPEDKPYEYSLYWEFLENSFVVYAHAAG